MFVGHCRPGSGDWLIGNGQYITKNDLWKLIKKSRKYRKETKGTLTIILQGCSNDYTLFEGARESVDATLIMSATNSWIAPDDNYLASEMGTVKDKKGNENEKPHLVLFSDRSAYVKYSPKERNESNPTKSTITLVSAEGEQEVVAVRVMNYSVQPDRGKPKKMYYMINKGGTLDDVRKAMKAKGCPGLELDQMTFWCTKDKEFSKRVEKKTLLDGSFKEKGSVYSVLIYPSTASRSRWATEHKF